MAAATASIAEDDPDLEAVLKEEQPARAVARERTSERTSPSLAGGAPGVTAEASAAPAESQTGNAYVPGEGKSDGEKRTAKALVGDAERWFKSQASSRWS